VVSCHPHDPATLATIETQLKKRYPRSGSMMRTTVDVRCDPVGAVKYVTAIVGEGHAGGITVAVFGVPDGGGDVALDIARYVHPYETYTEYSYVYSDHHTVDFAHASVPRAKTSSAIARARAALVSHIHAVAIESESQRGWGHSTITSSSWFREVAIQGDTRTLTAGMYGPQIGEDGMGERMSLEIAWDALEPLLAGAQPVTAASPELISAVRAAIGRVESRWALTRLAGIAGALEDRTLVGPLVAQLRVAKDTLRMDLVGAIAKITRFDVRTDDAGIARPIDAVTAEVLAECSLESERSEELEPSRVGR
jgi:hypothetical protein